MTKETLQQMILAHGYEGGDPVTTLAAIDAACGVSPGAEC